MAQAYNKFNCFPQDLAAKLHNLASDTFKIVLTNTLPIATNAVYTDLTDLATSGGYTAGGVACTITSAVQTSGTLKWLVAQPTLTASGGIGPFRYPVIYNTGGTKPLIGWWDYGSSVTMVTNDTFLIGLDQSAGVLTIA